MSKIISHYIAKYDMPFYDKGKKVNVDSCVQFKEQEKMYAKDFPDAFEPVYKESIIVPPGIKAFRDYNGNIIHQGDYGYICYNDWVELHFTEGTFPASTIYTISVNGVEWSVGDWYHHCDNRNHQIKSFEWRGTTWKFNTEEGLNTYIYKDIVLGENIFKGKYRKPICQLPDENGKMVDMFEGDISYWVHDESFEITEVKIRKDHVGSNYSRWYATKAAAEKYVRDNKPVYPAGLVEPLFYLSSTNQEYSYRIDNLKSFRDKLDKK
jgi:hypothetical protein